jgi:5-methylcytosine-specific restriction enzyme subunit McrC
MSNRTSTITLFEHQKRAYAELGWDADHSALAQIEQLNEAADTTLLQLGYRHLKATQFVGVLRLGDVTVQILPKIDYDPGGDPEAALESQLHRSAVQSATRNLLHFLSYTQDIQVREQDVASLLARRSDWFEILTRLFAANLHREMKRGVERAYVRKEEALRVIKGRWQLERQLTQHPHVKHIFDVVYDEFLADTCLNRVFRFVVERLLLRTQDRQNQRLLRDLREWLSEVTKVGRICQADLEAVHFTRLNERFRPSFNLARLFIENRAFQLSTGLRRTFAFVFDMNRLFEEFVYRFIERNRRRVLPDRWHDLRITAKASDRSVYLAEKLPGGRRLFRLVPDILFSKRSGQPVLVVDAKYKQLDHESRQWGVSERDVYQMLAYTTRLGCSNTVLLYPRWVGAPEHPMTIEIVGQDNRLVIASVNLRQSLDEPNNLIREMRQIFEEVTYYGTRP